MRQNKYEPDGTYILINLIWDLMTLLFVLLLIIVLLSVKEYDLKFFAGIFACFTILLNLLFSQISIRRLDKKYLDRLMNDPRVGNFIVLPLAFSRETLVKLKWMRASVYLFYYSRWPSLQKLRKEIIPEFDYKRDIKFLDKFLYWGQFVSLFAGAIIFFVS